MFAQYPIWQDILFFVSLVFTVSADNIMVIGVKSRNTEPSSNPGLVCCIN